MKKLLILSGVALVLCGAMARLTHGTEPWIPPAFEGPGMFFLALPLLSRSRK